jgi:lipopolysaccharide export system protein LptA
MQNRISKCSTMSRLLSISDVLPTGVFLVVLFLISANAFSAQEVKKITGPITVTSQMLTADNQAHTALFERSVVARTSDTTIYADRMLVYYEKDTGNVTKIEASGSVKFIRENRVITSKNAVYYAAGEKTVFTGDPRAVEGENVVTGTKITYLMNADRFLVEDSKVFLTTKKGK